MFLQFRVWYEGKYHTHQQEKEDKRESLPSVILPVDGDISYADARRKLSTNSYPSRNSIPLNTLKEELNSLPDSQKIKRQSHKLKDELASLTITPKIRSRNNSKMFYLNKDMDTLSLKFNPDESDGSTFSDDVVEQCISLQQTATQGHAGASFYLRLGALGKFNESQGLVGDSSYLWLVALDKYDETQGLVGDSLYLWLVALDKYDES